jgi:hypothetical protein
MAGFKTTEFVMMLAVVVAILIAIYVANADLGANEGWRYISWVAAAGPRPAPVSHTAIASTRTDLRHDAADNSNP